MQTSVVVVSDRIYFSAIYGNPWNLWRHLMLTL